MLQGYLLLLLKLNRPLGRFNYHLSKLAMYVAGALLAAMVLMILAQVVFRYALNDSLPWTEELARFLMVWVACLVAPWVYREDLNVSIAMFAEALPVLLRQLSELVITILVIGISAIFFAKSLDFWRGGLDIYASSMPLKLAYFYSCTPFAFASIFLVGIERFIQQFYNLCSGHHQTLDQQEML